jgi:hypothetical protein
VELIFMRRFLLRWLAQSKPGSRCSQRPEAGCHMARHSVHTSSIASTEARDECRKSWLFAGSDDAGEPQARCDRDHAIVARATARRCLGPSFGFLLQRLGRRFGAVPAIALRSSWHRYYRGTGVRLRGSAMSAPGFPPRPPRPKRAG